MAELLFPRLPLRHAEASGQKGLALQGEIVANANDVVPAALTSAS